MDLTGETGRHARRQYARRQYAQRQYAQRKTRAMKILSYKPGHDGHAAYLDGPRLAFSIEAEKDSWPRYASVSPSLQARCFDLIDDIPDVVAISGWVKGFHSVSAPVEGGYWGTGEETIVDRPQKLFGRDVRFFSSSHERSHLLCSYGLSPYPQGQPCYILVWEGNIGAFYRVDENVRFTKIGDVLEDPGNKYAFLYALGDPGYKMAKGFFRFEDAGKLMAIVSYGKSGAATPAEKEVIDTILAQRSILLSFHKDELSHSPFYNCGVESEAFKNLARKHSDAIFGRFYDFAEKNLKDGLPLLISGGCGLNCDWNSAWATSGLFDGTFVPPCTNDSGSAIGTAIDALRHYTGQAKIDWNVYAGEEFVMDEADLSGVAVGTADPGRVADFLAAGKVIAWVQGRYEIGPRALGNRSLIAAPFTSEMHARLNAIKAREGFRPIAPICMEEEIDRLFHHHGPSPHMLYFQKVKTDALKTITHVDGSARLQSVNAGENPRVHALLCAFKARTGYGVLCNTSLNFKGTGFINRMSDLVKYAREHGLDGFVVGDRFYDLCRTGETHADRQAAYA